MAAFDGKTLTHILMQFIWRVWALFENNGAEQLAFLQDIGDYSSHSRFLSEQAMARRPSALTGPDDVISTGS